MQHLGLTSVEAVQDLEAAFASTEGAQSGAAAALSMQRALGRLFSSTDDDAVEVFVPTGCYLILSAICQACPERQFTIADFNWLPPQPSGAVLAPVVRCVPQRIIPRLCRVTAIPTSCLHTKAPGNVAASCLISCTVRCAHTGADTTYGQDD